MWLSCVLEPLEKVRLIKRPDSSRQQTGVFQSQLIHWLTYTCRALACTSWQESLSPLSVRVCCVVCSCLLVFFCKTRLILAILVTNPSFFVHTHELLWFQRMRGRRWRHYLSSAFWFEVAGSAHPEQASEQLAYLKFFEAVICYQCSHSRIKEELMSTHCFFMHPARFHSISYCCFAFIQIFLGNWEKASQSLTGPL